MNLYWYCSDNPINYTDPLGLSTCSIVKLSSVKIDGKRFQGPQICEVICDMTANKIYYSLKDLIGKELYNSCINLPECHRKGELQDVWIITIDAIVDMDVKALFVECRCRITKKSVTTREIYNIIGN